jgi:hypothetical protein
MPANSPAFNGITKTSGRPPSAFEFRIPFVILTENWITIMTQNDACLGQGRKFLKSFAGFSFRRCNTLVQRTEHINNITN